MAAGRPALDGPRTAVPNRVGRAPCRARAPAGVGQDAPGFNDDTRAEECAQAIEAGGANELVVHARTKADAYRPLAHRHRIADIGAKVRLPVVANGDIWTRAMRCAAARCQAATASCWGAAWWLTRWRAAFSWRQRSAPPREPACQGEEVGWEMLLPLIADFWQIVCHVWIGVSKRDASNNG